MLGEQCRGSSEALEYMLRVESKEAFQFDKSFINSIEIK